MRNVYSLLTVSSGQETNASMAVVMTITRAQEVRDGPFLMKSICHWASFICPDEYERNWSRRSLLLVVVQTTKINNGMMEEQY